MGIEFTKLGKRIAQRRHELGYKQCFLAEKANISNNYLSNIENGRSIPSLETFMDICTALSVTPDYILLGTIKIDSIPNSIINNLKLCNDGSLQLVNSLIMCVLDNQEK